MRIKANIEFDAYDIVTDLHYDDAIKFIMEVDKAFADASFTEKLITELVKSLKQDSMELPFIKWDEVN